MRQGRFERPLEAEAASLNASIDFDKRLYEVDIAGSRAHARMLAKQNIISANEAETICRGLDAVKKEIEEGKLVFDPSLEDVHMNVEKRLTELVGDAGRKLHTGRSRNDQVATDLRLYAREQAGLLMQALTELRRSLVEQARKHVDTVLPGYTHLQRGQPVRLAHHLLAYVEMLGRDYGRVDDAARRANVSPLGSGALAGTPFPLDRNHTAKALGFSGVTHNSLDAVGDRDFAVEIVAACSLIMAHLSRYCDELVLWSTSEFGFVRLSEGYCSGSSLMPQKVNPDIPELVRGKSGRVYGDLMALLTVIKALPLAYNKDLQETQEPFYDAVETTLRCVRVATGMTAGLAFSVEKMGAACQTGFLLATEVADWLSAKGVPFRHAHDVAGRLVRRASERNVELRDLTLDEYRKEASEFDESVFAVLNVETAVNRRNLIGGPAKEAVLRELDRLSRELKGELAK